MDDKENSMGVTRAAKRKAAASMAESHVSTKKRVVLGELPNLSNPAFHPNQNQSSGVEPQKQKCGTKTKAKKALPMTKTLTTSKQDTESDDPQICGPYVSDLYAYLHQLEVVKMEADLLNSFKFELGNPTVKTFLRRFTRLAQENYKTQNLQLEFLTLQS